jgi:hypothetical protein
MHLSAEAVEISRCEMAPATCVQTAERPRAAAKNEIIVFRVGSKKNRPFFYIFTH